MTCTQLSRVFLIFQKSVCLVYTVALAGGVKKGWRGVGEGAGGNRFARPGAGGCMFANVKHG